MSDAPKTSEPIGYARLAKRLADWTTKGLLSALVLAAGLGFGRQALIWWRGDAAGNGIAAQQLLPDEALGDPEKPHSIRFGDAAWSLRRRTIDGDRAEAVAQLRADCREVLRAIKPRPLVAPGASVGVAVELPPPPPTFGAADGRGFLELLSDAAPVESEPGKWRLYEFHETFPMAVGLARSEAAEGDRSDLPRSGPEGAGHKSDLSPSPDLAQFGYRAIMWAIAVPAGENQWSLCVFQSVGSTAENRSGEAEPPLPPDCRRTLSLRAHDGGGITAFAGPDRPDDWKRFLDDWFDRRGWRAAIPWRAFGNAWYAKYAAPNDAGGTVEVRFGPDGRGELCGVMMFANNRTR